MYLVGDAVRWQVVAAGVSFWRQAETFGSGPRYPEITLKDARERRDEARKLLAIANGVDPSEAKKKA